MPLFGQKRNALVDDAQVHQGDVDQARLRLEEREHDGGDDGPGEEVRQIQDGLGDLLVAVKAQLVEQQRQDDGHGEADDQVEKVEDQRVPQRGVEALILEDLLKRLKAHPRAAVKALGRLVIHERDAHARIRRILEDDDKRDGNHQQRVELPVVFQIHLQLPCAQIPPPDALLSHKASSYPSNKVHKIPSSFYVKFIIDPQKRAFLQ